MMHLLQTNLKANHMENRLDSMDASMSATLQDTSQQLAYLFIDFRDHMTQCHGFFPPPQPSFDAKECDP